jgi:hypothetical protein
MTYKAVLGIVVDNWRSTPLFPKLRVASSNLNFAQIYRSPAAISFHRQPKFAGFSTWANGTEIHMKSDIHALLPDGRGRWHRHINDRTAG